MAGARFTLMAFRPEEGWPTVEFVDADETNDVLSAAHVLLDQGGYDSVEVSYAGRRVHTLRRAKAAD